MRISHPSCGFLPFLLVAGALAPACSAEPTTWLKVQVSLEAGLPAPESVQIEAAQGPRSLDQLEVAWSKAVDGVLKVALRLAIGKTEVVTVTAHGFTQGGEVGAATQDSVTVARGEENGPVMLVLKAAGGTTDGGGAGDAGAGQDGPTNDGPIADATAKQEGGATDGDARDAGATDGYGRDAGATDGYGRDAGATDGDGRDASATDGDGRDAGAGDAATLDALLPDVAVDQAPGSDAAPELPPPPPSLANCTEHAMWGKVECNPDTEAHLDDVVRSIAFSPNGQYVVASGMSGSTRVWKIEGTTLQLLDNPRFNSAAADQMVDISPDPDGDDPLGKYMVSGDAAGNLELFEFSRSLSTGLAVKVLLPSRPPSDEVYGVAFSPDGTRIVSIHKKDMVREGSIRVWQPEALAEVGAVDLTAAPSKLRMIPNRAAGTLWAAMATRGYSDASADAYAVILLNLATANPLATRQSIAMAESVSSLAVAPDGKTLAVGIEDGKVTLWDISDLSKAPSELAPALVEKPYGQEPTALAYAADSRHLLDCTGVFRGVSDMEMLSLAPRQSLGSLPVRYYPLVARFSPDGRAVAVGQNYCGTIVFCKD